MLILWGIKAEPQMITAVAMQILPRSLFFINNHRRILYHIPGKKARGLQFPGDML
jgi:hypothetical protein